MKKNNEELSFASVVLAVWFLVAVTCFILFLIAPAEGAAEPTPTAICENPPCYVLIPPTPTAPLPTCSDAEIPCFTPTPNGHWINPEPWPTYDYPDPYPAPTDEPTPAPYPEAESKSKPSYSPEPTLANSLWGWILDLFTN